VFHVNVKDGRTNAVRVDQGSVIVRLDGVASRSLSAGESWERRSDAVSMPVAPPPAPASSVPVATPSSSGAARSAPAAAPAARERAPRASSPSADAGEEDRAYVEIVRLLREGDEAGAKAAARDYVQRFPAGFRRTEVDRVLARRP
jgi:TolA-binding protein